MMPKNIRSIVVLTGAGISAESGLRTFRDADGLWEGHAVDEVATPEAFARNPGLVHHFYNERRRQLRDDQVQPNAAHQALGDFERQFDGDFLLVTQNVDDLHERGGSRRVVHMHGELGRIRCSRSGRIFDWDQDTHAELLCECCRQPGLLRPHIVWFGEIPLSMDIIETAVSRCDLFVSIGTSGAVYPAAGLRQIADAYGAHTVELNKEPSNGARYFDECHYGLATEVVTRYFGTLSDRLAAHTGW